MNIRNYIVSYSFDGKLDHIYKKYDQNDIINEVLDILENTSKENTLNMELFNISMTFVRDTIISSDLSTEDKNTFVNKLIEWKYVEKIEKYLYNDYLNIKNITVYNIGRMSTRENVKYLEKAFEHYFNQNPLVSSNLLTEIKWLGSDKYRHYCSMLEKNMDLINTITLCLYLAGVSYDDKLVKIFNGFKNNFKELFGNKEIEANDYFNMYEIMVCNLHSKIVQKDWIKEEYTKSIIYFTKYFGEIFNGNKIDYKKINKEIIK
jgi:hypothetical protein